ncbi:MAG: GIY-YIG nuclease family protein [Flavobacteriaceae bacterium]|nr:GIY-YIG nuclease family protein [Flavobacteriaceae bacterium]
MYYVYEMSNTLRACIYVRFTASIENRLHRHQHGYEKTTKAYWPFKLIYSEECLERNTARKC